MEESGAIFARQIGSKTSLKLTVSLINRETAPTFEGAETRPPKPPQMATETMAISGSSDGFTRTKRENSQTCREV